MRDVVTNSTVVDMSQYVHLPSHRTVHLTHTQFTGQLHHNRAKKTDHGGRRLEHVVVVFLIEDIK